jgi:IMP dehydrogenase
MRVTSTTSSSQWTGVAVAADLVEDRWTDLLMAQVSDILGAKGRDVLRIDGSATVLDAVKTMVEGNVGALIVTESGQLAGIVTERDYLRRVTLEGRDERTTPVREIMSAPFVYIGPEATIDECMAIMTERRFRHLPVLDDDRNLVGIVSIGDVVKFQSQEQGVQIKFLTEFISG